jgi:hypothetical protein
MTVIAVKVQMMKLDLYFQLLHKYAWKYSKREVWPPMNTFFFRKFEPCCDLTCIVTQNDVREERDGERKQWESREIERQKEPIREERVERDRESQWERKEMEREKLIGRGEWEREPMREERDGKTKRANKRGESWKRQREPVREEMEGE